MNKETYTAYCDILRSELIPAMGCTEPIALALTAAIARKHLEGDVTDVHISTSGNIIKNAKSVTVPHTNGVKGIDAACAAGIVAGDPDAGLEVLSRITPQQQKDILDFLHTVPVTVSKATSEYLLDIEVTLQSVQHTVYARTAQYHTGLCMIKVDGKTIFEQPVSQTTSSLDHSVLNMKEIIEFADTCNIEDVKDLLDTQINYNMAISEEGISGKYGAAVGRTLLMAYGDSVHNRAKAYAASGSDARMNGCELPVVINSGSGNQGITTSVPVIIYARELHVSQDKLYRALLVANLTSIHLKTGIGCLSAYCGATSAGCGAGAGITYLYGGKLNEISHTVVNALAINSGVVCDGAKASCAAKIASAVESGLLGMQMYMHGKQFYRGDGIVAGNVEDTIRNVGQLAHDGMAETDKEIIRIMLENKC